MNAVLTRAILCIVCWASLAIAGNMAYAKNPRVREFVIDKKMAEQVTNLTGQRNVPCRIRFTDERGRNLDDRDYFRKQFPINMYCLNVDDKWVSDGWARFDEKERKWKVSYIDDEDRKLIEPGTKIYQIKAINNQGYVVTVNQINGAPESRERIMYFCLLHPPKALCGHGPVMRLSDPQSNVLPYVLKLLRSVEFIDDAPAAVSPALPGPGTAQP